LPMQRAQTALTMRNRLNDQAELVVQATKAMAAVSDIHRRTYDLIQLSSEARSNAAAALDHRNVRIFQGRFSDMLACSDKFQSGIGEVERSLAEKQLLGFADVLRLGMLRKMANDLKTERDALNTRIADMKTALDSLVQNKDQVNIQEYDNNKPAQASDSNAHSSSILFRDSFETSSNGVSPIGWEVINLGNQIRVSDRWAYDGHKSVFIRGVPYGGARIGLDISSLGLNSGKCKIALYTIIDLTNWRGNDGLSALDVRVAGYMAGICVEKTNNVFSWKIYGIDTQYPNIPLAYLPTWIRYDLVLDIDSHTYEVRINGASIGGGRMGQNSGPDRLYLVAGSAGPGRGTPSVYFDSLTIEKY